MKEKQKKQEAGIKIIFSIISLFLMIVPMAHGRGDYYTTLFIFLINRVIDLFIKTEQRDQLFILVWGLVNQWMGTLVCAVSFCMMHTEFKNLVGNNKEYVISIILFLIAVSFVVRDLVYMIIRSFKAALYDRMITNDMKKLKGENG